MQDTMKKNRTFYELVSTHRSEIMGVAILWVLWFHSPLNLVIPGNNGPVAFGNRVLEFIKYTGYGGVDIFLFVSGIGITNSLMKNDISRYFKNRIVRIVPTWWTFLFVFEVPYHLLFKMPMAYQDVIGYATFTGYWFNMPNQGNWYCYAIFALYMIAPILVGVVTSGSDKRKTTAVLIVLLLIISSAFWGNDHLLIFFTRIPVFLLGIFFATNSGFREQSNKRKNWVICIGLLMAGIVLLWCFYFYLNQYLWEYGLWWYPFILIAPSTVVMMAYLFDRMLKGRSSKIFAIIGNSSLEILLISGWLAGISIYVINSKTVRRILCLLMSVVLGILFHIIIKKIIGIVDGMKERR